VNQSREAKNKAVVLEAFEALFNKEDYTAAGRVLVARLYSAQRAHRPGRTPVRPYQEHPADAEIRAGDDRGRRGYRDRPRAVLGISEHP